MKTLEAKVFWVVLRVFFIYLKDFFKINQIKGCRSD